MKAPHPAPIIIATTALVCVWAGVFAWYDDVPYLTGLYWAVTTATTVGYGDITAHGNEGMLLAMGCMLTTIPMMAASWSTFHVHKLSKHLDKREAEKAE